MADIDPDLRDAIAAREAGRMDDALRLMKGLLDRAGGDGPSVGASVFIVTFEWSRLVEAYPPARDALASARDEHARRLLGGDDHLHQGGPAGPRSRFAFIAGLDQILGDTGATYDLFVQLERTAPQHARRVAHLALPSIVKAGDFRLAERYLPDPLGWLDHLNRLARDFPLYPPPRAAPRLAGELMGFTKEVSLRAAVLNGLGRGADAEALHDTALAGIESDELRALAQRELAQSGTIAGAISEHEMSQDPRF